MVTAAKKTGAKQKPATAAKLDALPTPDEAEKQAKSPYPDTVRVYAYQPKGGGEPILLALNGFEVPDKLWHFDVAQLPLLSQTWKWMDRANIPKAIQRQALSLPDKEYFEMFDEWFSVMTKLRGAAKGAVTAGK
jgi:hypothetical protein